MDIGADVDTEVLHNEPWKKWNERSSGEHGPLKLSGARVGFLEASSRTRRACCKPFDTGGANVAVEACVASEVSWVLFLGIVGSEMERDRSVRSPIIFWRRALVASSSAIFLRTMSFASGDGCATLLGELNCGWKLGWIWKWGLG